MDIRPNEKILELRAASHVGPNQLSFFKVSLDLSKNTTLGLYGDRDSGSSEILKSIYGLISIEEGTLSVFNLNPKSHTSKIREMTGWLSAQPLFDDELKVMESLQFWCSLYGINPDASYRKILEWSRHLEIEVGEGDDYEQFDEFEKQKISLLQCLLTDPQLILMDGYADRFHGAQLDWWLRFYNQHISGKYAVLVYSQKSELLEKMATSTAIMNRGKLTGIKSNEEWREEVESKEIVHINCTFEEAQYLLNKLRHFRKVFQTDLGLRVYLHKEQSVHDVLSVIERPSLTVRRINLGDVHLHHTGRLIIYEGMVA